MSRTDTIRHLASAAKNWAGSLQRSSGANNQHDMPITREVGYGTIQRMLEVLNPDFGRYMAGQEFIQSPLTYENTNIYLDHVFSFSRRILQRDRFWRYGSHYVRDTARESTRTIIAHGTLVDKRFCDLGCGALNPFAISAVMYLNGVRSCIALDIAETDRIRASEGLYDLLAQVLCYPDEWHWSMLPREQFLDRVRHFQRKALEDGDLAAGLEGVPIRHVVTDIHDPALEDNSVDVMSSRAVLEHFLNFSVAAQRLHTLMAPGGIAFHLVDRADHRSYTEPEKYHAWSMLAEDQSWSDGLVNRLRACELRQELEAAGIKVLSQENEEWEVPPGFRGKLKGRFRSTPDAELSIVRVKFVLQKPH